VIAWTAIVVMGDYSSSLRVAHSGSKRWWLRWYGSRRYRQFGWVFGVVVTVAYIAIFAGGRANAIYEGRRGKEVRVTLTNDAAEKTAVLLGSTISFLFLYDRDRRIVSIHPYENVLSVDSDVPRQASVALPVTPRPPPVQP
jgi:hypothetical protein